MNYIDNVKPISYLKSNTADIVKQLNTCRAPMLITQNGVVQLVVQDVYSYQQQQQTIAMLTLLAQGQQQIAEGKVKDADDVFARFERTR